MRLLDKTRKLLVSKPFFALLAVLGALVRVTGNYVTGAAVFICITVIVLLVSNDTVAAFCPVLILCIFVCECYDSFDTFIKFWWLVFPVVGALLFHFIYYRAKFIIGETFSGIVAVGAAVLLGGVATISAKDYFSPITLFYTLSLSFGMVLTYLLIRSGLGVDRGYKTGEKFAEIMYAMGMFACFTVLWHYVTDFEIFRETKQILNFQPRNNYSTFLIFSLPYPFYFALKKRFHLIFGILIFVCIVLSGSRGGLLAGSAGFIASLVYFALAGSGKKNKAINIFISLAVLAALIFSYQYILEIFAVRLQNGHLIDKNEARFKLIFRAIDCFRENPLFGSGIGFPGNVDLYNPKKGSLYWYHSLPLQLLGSMGICGVCAYAWSVFLRFRAVIRKIDPLKAAIGVGYLGMLLMSCVNPGEFSPVPYQMMVIISFAVLEAHEAKKKKARLEECEAELSVSLSRLSRDINNSSTL